MHSLFLDVGLFLLDILNKLLGKNYISLYRDDGLSKFRNYNDHPSDKIRKDLRKLFLKYQLNLDIKCNLKIGDDLDITFDLNIGIYKPFNKPNNKPLYINGSSNHPPPVLKQISKYVSNRIIANSSNKDIFRTWAPFYNLILQDCRFNENIKNTAQKNRCRQEKGRTVPEISYGTMLCSAEM